MDVQAATATAPIPPSYAPVSPAPPSTGGPSAPDGTPNSSAVAPVGPAPAPVGLPAPASSGNGLDPSLAPPIGPDPGLATLPPAPSGGSSGGGAKQSAPSEPTLAANVAKLFNTAAANVTVSFQIDHNPNEIVTVFTDKTTGKVIVQFPPETLIALGQFFDKLDGSVVNQKV